MPIFRLSVPPIPDGTNQTLIPRKNIGGKITSQRRLCQVDVYGSAQRRDSFLFYLLISMHLLILACCYISRLAATEDKVGPGHEIYNPSTAGRGRLASLEEDARREAVSVNCSQRRQFAKIQKLASQFWELGSFPGLPSIVTGKPEVTPEDRNSRHYFRLADHPIVSAWRPESRCRVLPLVWARFHHPGDSALFNISVPAFQPVPPWPSPRSR